MIGYHSDSIMKSLCRSVMLSAIAADFSRLRIGDSYSAIVDGAIVDGMIKSGLLEEKRLIEARIQGLGNCYHE